MNVVNEPGKCLLLTKRGKVSRLGLESADILSGRIDNVATELEHGTPGKMFREPLRNRIKTDAKQGVLIAPRLAQLGHERLTLNHIAEYTQSDESRHTGDLEGH